jgi:sensor c-di-GMP phosphodiesterase-like protein
MGEFTKVVLIALIPGLVLSIVTAFLTVRLSLKQFRSQRWWEKRAEAYSRIMEQLSSLLYYYEEWESEEVSQREWDEEKKKRVSDGHTEANRYIRKASAIGAFMISDVAAAAIETLLRDLRKNTKEPDYYSYLDACQGSIEKCIIAVRGFAKADLLE